MLQPSDFPQTKPSLLATMRDQTGSLAWREFFARYAPAVYRVARARRLCAQDADDIVQQVMLAIATRIHGFSYDRDRGKFRNWVRTIAENEIRKTRRRSKTQAEAPLATRVDHQVSVEASWEQEWRLQDVFDCLEKIEAHLAPERAAAFRLYVLEGWSAADTAKHLSMTVGHVYVTRTQVINRIREKMGENRLYGDER